MRFLPLLFLSAALAQTPTYEEKLRALQLPVCVLPYNQLIELKDLPTRFYSGSWMSKLPDDSPISLVSIPATHDAGTGLAQTGGTRCQVLTIPAQLSVGFRGYDIRLRLVNDELGVYHNEESQRLSFKDVMEAFSVYLKEHPTEFLVMRIREESKALNSTKSFDDAFAEVRGSDRYGSLFYAASSRNEIPTVGQLRGKVLLLDNYGNLPQAVDYPNPSMSVQDDYDTSDMDKKYREIIAKFQDALDEKTGAVWDVNYTSSATSQVDQLQNAKAVNAKVERWLRGKKGHLGLVFTNFAGIRETRDIIDSNFP
jgi:1-phosphatidylinositol phosphodiesterase